MNISHFYGANVAHFHLVMLAYDLMNLFKELVLGQKDRKRMGGLYLIRREKEIDGKRNKGRKPFYVKVCSIDRKGLGITIC